MPKKRTYTKTNTMQKKMTYKYNHKEDEYDTSKKFLHVASRKSNKKGHKHSHNTVHGDNDKSDCTNDGKTTTTMIRMMTMMMKSTTKRN